MICRCIRTHYSNKTLRVYKAEESYDIDEKDERVARFFDVPKPVKLPTAKDK